MDMDNPMRAVILNFTIRELRVSPVFTVPLPDRAPAHRLFVERIIPLHFLSALGLL